LAASSCTWSSHLIFYLPMGLLPPRLSSRICFWGSFCRTSLLHTQPNLIFVWANYPFLEQECSEWYWAEKWSYGEKFNISNYYSLGILFEYCAFSSFQTCERSLMQLLGGWVKNERNWKYWATACHKLHCIQLQLYSQTRTLETVYGFTSKNCLEPKIKMYIFLFVFLLLSWQAWFAINRCY
jgi:hypothetical protein